MRWSLILSLGIPALVCAAFFVGRASRPPAMQHTGGARQPLYYIDPMHPSYRSDHPGKAPDCGMDLQPVYADGGVRLTPEQEQAIHLETETVQTGADAREVQTVGRVVPDESLTYRVSAGVDGWVRQVYSDRTGTQVKKGDRLAAFYSKEISSPQQAFIYALESFERLKAAASPPSDQLALAAQQLATARDNLRFVGMGEAQIDELGRTRREAFDVDLTASGDGQILERNVAVGQRFMKGETLYRLANLCHVWVLADVYARDSASTGAIRQARIRVEGLPPVDAAVASAPPLFDADGRAGKLRLVVDNGNRRLIPGMIVTVTFQVPARRAMTLHADAVLDSGMKKRVFVALGEGKYELREVETGWQEGDRIEIRGGLKEGERVVTAGAFLLDSESRMKNPGLRERPIQ